MIRPRVLLAPKSLQVKSALTVFTGVHVFVSALLALIHHAIQVAESRAQAEDDQKTDFNRAVLL